MTSLTTTIQETTVHRALAYLSLNDSLRFGETSRSHSDSVQSLVAGRFAEARTDKTLAPLVLEAEKVRDALPADSSDAERTSALRKSFFTSVAKNAHPLSSSLHRGIKDLPASSVELSEVIAPTLDAELAYTPTTPLGRLYAEFTKPVAEYSRTDIAAAIELLPLDMRRDLLNIIVFVYLPRSEQLRIAEEHLRALPREGRIPDFIGMLLRLKANPQCDIILPHVTDLRVIGRALKMIIIGQFHAMTPEQRTEIYAKIISLTGQAAAKKDAYAVITRLADLLMT